MEFALFLLNCFFTVLGAYLAPTYFERGNIFLGCLWTFCVILNGVAVILFVVSV